MFFYLQSNVFNIYGICVTYAVKQLLLKLLAQFISLIQLAICSPRFLSCRVSDSRW